MEKVGYLKAEDSQRTLSDCFFYAVRAGVIFSLVCLFIPGLNPARVSGMISSKLSLFTVGVSYSSLVSQFGRAFRKEWITYQDVRILYASALVVIVGVVMNVANGCLSLGNTKMKKLGLKIGLGGSVVELAGMAGIYAAYLRMCQTSNPDKIEPMFPGVYWVILVVFILVLILNLIQVIGLSRVPSEENYHMETKFSLFLMLLPFIALCAVFSYLPLWGWRYAFFDYKAGQTLTWDKFVGFKWFTQLFRNSATVRDVINVMKNTLAMSGLGIATSWLPMAFAIFLSEMKNNKFRRLVQTCTTIPNFISWVLVYAIAVCIFSTDGFISSLMVNLGVWDSGKNMLMSNSHTWLKMWAWGTWKGVGWSAIIYIAAISGIDQQLYESARVDGAGRFARMWHITVPGLMPTFFVLLLMSIANILTNGMDQYLVFENAVNSNSVMVLDLYVYKLGIQDGSIALSTVIGMLKSIISVILLFGANGFSKLVRGESII
ncbi:MAG: ABC transporter permease subunit [Lachnospiraceae bacterium]|nr:ABC transporter permease subunit [Lachnospiraceae bacterium]